MLLIGNGRLITRGREAFFRENGCVRIEGSVIVEIGTTSILRAKYPKVEFLDARGGVIMPGFINMHHHIYSAFARGLSINGYQPRNFLDILSGLWWRLDRMLSLEDVKHSAYVTYLDCIKNGVTTVFDHHASYGSVDGSLFAISDAAEELGVRTCLCYEVSDREGEEKMRQAVLENASFIRASLRDESDMQKGMMGMHAAFTLSDATLDYCAANTPEDAGYHIHVAEGIDDEADSLKKYGKRVVNRLFDHGILGEKTIAGHCIHINGLELELLRETGTMVVHNPESNMGNAVGCPAVLEMIRRGVLTGLGTDGYTSDMLESYKAANILHKHHLCDSQAAWAEVPQMLFSHNAVMANRYFAKKLGVLEAGAAADVIVADYIPPTPMHAGNVNAHILFGMSGRSVTSTVINGKVLMRDRQMTNADEERLLARAREQAAFLWNRMNA